MMTYSEYKSVPHLWDISIPSHWKVLPLYAIAKEKSICNCTDLQLLSVYLDEGVVPFSTRTERRTNATSADLSKYQRVDAGDFVLNNQQAWRGSVGVSRHTGIVSPAYVVLQMDDTLISEYANYTGSSWRLLSGRDDQKRRSIPYWLFARLYKNKNRDAFPVWKNYYNVLHKHLARRCQFTGG